MRTTWKNNGTIRASKRRMLNVGTRATANEPVSRTGTKARSPVAYPRRVVRRYRTVSQKTTQPFRATSARPIRSTHQVPEDRVEGIVGAFHRVHLEALVDHDGW